MMELTTPTRIKIIGTALDQWLEDTSYILLNEPENHDLREDYETGLEMYKELTNRDWKPEPYAHNKRSS